MAFVSLNPVDTEPVEHGNMVEVEEAWERTQGNYAVDSLGRFAEIYSGTVTEAELEAAVENMTYSGVYNSNRQRTSTYLNWSDRVAETSTYIESTGLSQLNISIENLTVETESVFSVQAVGTSRKVLAEQETYIHGVEDPLLEGTSYARNIDRCTFDVLARQLYNGNISSGTVRGRAVVNPSNPDTVSSPGDKIVVSRDITVYNRSDIQSFLGYFSQVQPGNPGDYNSNYVAGTSGMPRIEDGSYVIIHTGFWRSNFQTAVSSGCYMPSSLADTPSVLNRFNGKTRGSTSEGIYTVLSPAGPSSDIGYERLDNSSLTLKEIETISEPGTYPGFRISQSLAESTGLSELVK